ncbi:uncharacterized protein LOC126743737 [Anthonomus grandis grandis]|uniref:uncharacterized protein LOC126743737 n=1 Tax=Anthonomus grandis grandis TaxID=2921223 RepID=UPI002165A5C1|nr:uncharacterized protein LOC126743737 [Anthonomus grandis grandis]
MFSSAQQSGFISIFYSVGSNPLALWDKQVKNGHIRRVIDDEVKSLVLDIGGTNVATTYITCPIKPRASLGVKLPFLVMVIKNMKKYFSFEIQILDDKEMRRRFRVSNFQSTTKVRPFCTTMPIGLAAGWNQVQFNLADFTKRAYGSVYLETVRVQIHANVRIRRIYFTDQLHSDDDLPNEFKLFAPGSKDQKAKPKDKKASKEALVEQTPPEVPPIKTDKLDEEVPPPPTPAEESPIGMEDMQEGPMPSPEGEVPPQPEGDEIKPEAVDEVPAEAPPEAPPAEEGAVAPVEEEGASAPAEGGDEAPAEGEAEVKPVETGAVEEEVEVKEEPAVEEGPIEGAPAEELNEDQVKEETQEVAAVLAEEEAAAPAEAGAEVSEPVETSEMTEATVEAADTEGSPTEPPTTDNEGEA